MCLVSTLFRLLHIPPGHWVQIPEKLVHKDRRPFSFCDRIDRHSVGCSEIDSSKDLHVKKKYHNHYERKFIQHPTVPLDNSFGKEKRKSSYNLFISI